MTPARTMATAYFCATALCVGAAEIETITVVASTPVGENDLDVRDFPGSIQTADADDLRAIGSADVSSYLARHARGVHINSAQGNPLQSDLYYRGYAASPLLGLPMGLTVYQDGVRLNEPLGDAVNWDLVPTRAVASMSLLGGSNPLYGLNTLGGSIVADPPLKEVVARSVELGARGTNQAGWRWSLGLFHAYNDNDIIWQTGQTRAHGLFRNVTCLRPVPA